MTINMSVPLSRVYLSKLHMGYRVPDIHVTEFTFNCCNPYMVKYMLAVQTISIVLFCSVNTVSWNRKSQ